MRLTRQNQAFEQTRDSVLRHGDPVGRELLNLVVRRQGMEQPWLRMRQSRLRGATLRLACA